MSCRECSTQIADDAKFCHKCGAKVVRKVEPSVPVSASSSKTKDNVKYDIMLVEITTREDISEKAHMAVAYVLFEDEIKRVSGGSDPNPEVKRQVQDEAVRNAYSMAKTLPVALKRSVRKKEALFFKERLALYGVTVLIGFCPDCGGSLDNTSERCAVCGQTAIELNVDGSNVIEARTDEPMLGKESSFCPRCGTISQGEATFCRKCGYQSGNPPAFAPQAIAVSEQTTDVADVLDTIKTVVDIAGGIKNFFS